MKMTMPFSLAVKVKKYLLKEQIFVFKHFYNHLNFALADLSLLLISFFVNPFRVSKRFLKKKGEKIIHAYGETPLRTLQNIVNECSLTKEDIIFEMGSGRGKGAFWLASFVGCEVIGIEKIPLFANVAKMIARIYGYKRLNFARADMFDINLDRATFLYLYGTLLNDSEIKALVEKFVKELSSRAKILTVSFPLTDYAVDKFEILKSFSLSFPWGETTAYLQKVKVGGERGSS